MSRGSVSRASRSVVPDPSPGVTVLGPRRAGQVRSVVLVLHGGQETSQAPAHRLRPAYLRMLPFAVDLARTGRPHGVAVWLLRYRYRGWNAPVEDPVADARWALLRVRAEHPDLPVVLIGHSMGGRVALRVADDPAVRGVGALAPWTPRGEPVDHLVGRTVLIAHGALDTLTDPGLSYAFALRAKRVTGAVCRFDLPGEGHAMLRRPAVWTRLVRGFTLGVLGARPFPAPVANALAAPVPDGLRIPL